MYASFDKYVSHIRKYFGDQIEERNCMSACQTLTLYPRIVDLESDRAPCNLIKSLVSSDHKFSLPARANSGIVSVSPLSPSDSDGIEHILECPKIQRASIQCQRFVTHVSEINSKGII